MRLDRCLAELVGLTRTQARQAIRAGQVRVHGQIVLEVAVHVDVNTELQLEWQGSMLGAPVGSEYYYMYHKPVGEVCSHQDAHHPLVIDRWPSELRLRLQMVGRLDCATSGLLLLTTDGQWSHQVRKPGRHLKRYEVGLSEDVSRSMQEQLLAGVMLKGDARSARACALYSVDVRTVRMDVDEGRYHLVRRLWAAVGNHVLTLHRVAIGSLRLDPLLSPGCWRTLSVPEVSLLRSVVIVKSDLETIT